MKTTTLKALISLSLCAVIPFSLASCGTKLAENYVYAQSGSAVWGSSDAKGAKPLAYTWNGEKDAYGTANIKETKTTLGGGMTLRYTVDSDHNYSVAPLNSDCGVSVIGDTYGSFCSIKETESGSSVYINLENGKESACKGEVIDMGKWGALYMDEESMLYYDPLEENTAPTKLCQTDDRKLAWFDRTVLQNDPQEHPNIIYRNQFYYRYNWTDPAYPTRAETDLPTVIKYCMIQGTDNLIVQTDTGEIKLTQGFSVVNFSPKDLTGLFRFPQEDVTDIPFTVNLLGPNFLFCDVNYFYLIRQLDGSVFLADNPLYTLGTTCKYATAVFLDQTNVLISQAPGEENEYTAMAYTLHFDSEV